MVQVSSVELIRTEADKLIENSRKTFQEVKKVALVEAWKLLQLAISAIIQIIEAIGNDLSGPDKKALAMDILDKFYDRVFIVIDIPVVPNILEPFIHKYTKQFLMMLADSTIDSMVTIFRNTGVFVRKFETESTPT